MSDVLVAEQLTQSLGEVPQYESKFSEGDTGELRLYLTQDLSQIQIDNLESDIIGKGIVLTNSVVQDARILIISFKKAMPPLSEIKESISKIGGQFIIGWQLFKDEKWGMPLWAWALIGGALIYSIIKSRS